MSYTGTMNNQPVEVLNVWSEENPTGKYMPYTTGANSQKANYCHTLEAVQLQ